MTGKFSIRLAKIEDIPALETFIPLSARALLVPAYSMDQIEAALGPVFGVDRLLIRDRTYFIVEHEGTLVGCGGWSNRNAVFGGDRDRQGEDACLDPERDPARIRAFFVHPDWTRQGIGRMLLSACETAICTAGFQEATLVATLSGESLYLALGYGVIQRYDVELSGGINLPVIRMFKNFRTFN